MANSTLLRDDCNPQTFVKEVGEATNIQIEDLFYCLICKKMLQGSERKHLNIFTDMTAHSCEYISNVISRILEIPLFNNQVFSDVICHRCFCLIDNWEDMTIQTKKIKSTLLKWYNESISNDEHFEVILDKTLASTDNDNYLSSWNSNQSNSLQDYTIYIDHEKTTTSKSDTIEDSSPNDPDFNPFSTLQKKSLRGKVRGKKKKLVKIQIEESSKDLNEQNFEDNEDPDKFSYNVINSKIDELHANDSNEAREGENDAAVTSILPKDDAKIDYKIRELHTSANSNSADKLSVNSEALFVSSNLHEKNNSKLKSHTCTVCNEQFCTIADYKVHIKLHRNLECKLCNKVVSKPGMLQQHYIKYHDLPTQKTGDYICWVCGKCYKSHSAVSYHVTSVHDNHKYPCEVCGKEFSHIKNLKAHAKRHKEKNEVCSLCNAKFYTTSELGYHYNAVHMKARCWKCNVCGTEFSRSSTYFHHIEKHKQKKFECVVCLRKFRRKTQVQSHMKLHVLSNDQMVDHIKS